MKFGVSLNSLIIGILSCVSLERVEFLFAKGIL